MLETEVAWLAKGDSETRVTIVQVGPGGGGVPPNNNNNNNMVANIGGHWRCSCGEIWDLTQTGNAGRFGGATVTGTESNGQFQKNNVQGTFAGQVFKLTYRHSNGLVGQGVLTPGRNLNTMTGTISWSDGRQDSKPTLTRLGGGQGGQGGQGPLNTYTVVSMKNVSNVSVEGKIRWSNGATQNVSIRPGVTFTYYTFGKSRSLELRVTVLDQTGVSYVDTKQLTATSVTLNRTPTSRDATRYGVTVSAGSLGVINLP